MKKIAMLTCLKATSVCSGAGCFNALNNRTGSFSKYKDEDIEVAAFFHCNGCNADYNNNSEFNEKIERVRSINPDAIHIGRCAYPKNTICPVIQNMINYFEDNNIEIIMGTH